MSGSEKSDLSGALALGRELDLILPDSRAVRDAYAQAEAESLNRAGFPGGLVT
jgi:hypothetical protein